MVINGKEIAEKIISDLRFQISDLRNKRITPGLAIITLGPDSAWKAYVGQKLKLAARLGIHARLIKLEKPTEPELLKTIEQLNNDNNIHGIIAQRPFPKNIDDATIVEAISPQKDIDGFRKNSPYLVPVWLAVEHLLQKISNVPDRGQFIRWLGEKNIVIVGKGVTAGGPIQKALTELGIRPIVIDSKTNKSHELLSNADIIVTATGKRVVERNNLKRGVILIGVGLNRGEDEKLHGDYDEEEIKDIASFYTPTPGGVGPVNLAYLFKNLVQAAQAI